MSRGIVIGEGGGTVVGGGGATGSRHSFPARRLSVRTVAIMICGEVVVAVGAALENIAAEGA